MPTPEEHRSIKNRRTPSSSEAGRPIAPTPERTVTPGITYISAVVARETRYNRTPNLIFIGWTGDGKPAITDGLSGLSEQGRRSFASHRASIQDTQYDYRRTQYSDLQPIEFEIVGRLIDYKPQGKIKLEDLMEYEVADSSGRKQEILLQETAVLQAIVEAGDFWQDRTADRIGSTWASAPKEMYTLIVPSPDLPSGSAYAIMFRPNEFGQSNASMFTVFVRDTIFSLLKTDIPQDADDKKWYEEALINMAPKEPEPQGFFAGFVKFVEEAVFEENKSPSKPQKSILDRILEPVFSDSSESDQSTPNIPLRMLSQLTTRELVTLAGHMHFIATRALNK